MSVEIRVPALGESIVDATIATWLKHEGDPVQQGDVLVELETDKVNVEVNAEQSGVLQQVIKKEGDNVAVGDVLGIIGAAAETAPPERAQPDQAADGRQPARRTTGELVPTQQKTASERAPSALARKIAAEHNVDLSQVKSSSPHGRITREDVLSYLEQSAPVQEQPAASPSAAPVAPTPPAPSPAPRTATSAPPAPVVPTPVPVPQPALDRREERVRLSRRRQTIAQRLVEAQHTAAMLTTFNEIDMSAVMEMRSRRRDSFKERHQISLGFMSFFTKATVGALKAFPRLNAEIQGNEMILKRYYDIGIAVGAEEGLVVPVLRDADRKSFAEIEREIAELAERARANTLSLAELQGGTFTITNGGVFGSLLSTPILHPPQSGILGLHAIQERPVAINRQVEVRPMMYVALSYDHRLVDGSDAVSFLVRVKRLLEEPLQMMLEI